MKVREVMSSPVITVGPSTPFSDVVDALLTNDISGVPVVDESDHLVGMVTEADLVSKEAYGRHRRRALNIVTDYLQGKDPQWVRKGAARTAAELMTANPATASPDEELAVAARRMLEDHHKRLPIVEGDRLVGIVSRHDLLEPFHRGDEAILSELNDVLSDVLRVPESHRATASVSDGVVTLQGDAQWPSDVRILGEVVSRLPGVVGVENQLVPRDPEPTVSAPQH